MGRIVPAVHHAQFNQHVIDPPHEERGVFPRPDRLAVGDDEDRVGVREEVAVHGSVLRRPQRPRRDPPAALDRDLQLGVDRPPIARSLHPVHDLAVPHDLQPMHDKQRSSRRTHRDHIAARHRQLLAHALGGFGSLARHLQRHDRPARDKRAPRRHRVGPGVVVQVILAGMDIRPRGADRGMPPDVRHHVRAGGPRNARTRVEESVPHLGRPELVAPDARDVHKVGQAENRVDGQLARISHPRRVQIAMHEPEGVDVTADAALLMHPTKHVRVVRVEGMVRGPHRADVEGCDQLDQIEEREVGEEAWPVLLVVVDDGAGTGVRVRVPQEVLQILDPAVAPVVGDHAVRHVQILGVRLVAEVLGGHEVVAAVVGMDVVVARVPAVRRHVDPAVELDLDGGVLARPHLDRARDGLVFKAPPDLQARLAQRQRCREAAVGVEVVVLGDAHDAGIAAVGEVGAVVGAGQVDARRQQLAVGVGDAHPQSADRLRPRVVVDPHPPGLATAPSDDVEPETHPVVDRARLVVGPPVARVHDVAAVGRPRREVLVRAGVREPHWLDAPGRFLAGDGVDVVVARGVCDVGDDAPMRGDDRRRLVVGLDANEEFRLPGAGTPSP